MIKCVMVCLAMLPAVASAWETPLQAVEQFVAWELGGGRLHSDAEGMQQHLHLEPDYEGIGADTVLLSSGHRLGKPRCHGSSCTVVVNYQLPALTGEEELPLGNGPRARNERVSYRILAVDGDWRIDSGSLTDTPIINAQTLAAHTAMLAADDEPADQTQGPANDL